MTGLLDPTFKEVRIGVAAGARHLQGAEVRHDRRLHGHRRPHHPRRRHARRACCATTSSSTKARSDRCAASRTTSARSRPASSAASASRSSTTSRSATSSRSSRWNGSLTLGVSRESKVQGSGSTEPSDLRLRTSTTSHVPRLPSRPRRRPDSQRARARCSRARCTIPGIGFVTLTRVQVSPTCSRRACYYTALGDDKARAATRTRALERAIAVPAAPDRIAAAAEARRRS